MNKGSINERRCAMQDGNCNLGSPAPGTRAATLLKSRKSWTNYSSARPTKTRCGLISGCAAMANVELNRLVSIKSWGR